MKGCCNVRVLSYVVAVFHLVVNALGMIILIGAMVMYFQPETKDNKDEDIKEIPFRRIVILFLTSLAVFITSIILIRGIKVKKPSLILPFLICMAVVIGINIGHEIISFIVSLVRKEPFSSVIVTFVCGCLGIAIAIALVTPVYLLYRKLNQQNLATPPKIPDDCQPEQQTNHLNGGQI